MNYSDLEKQVGKRIDQHTAEVLALVIQKMNDLETKNNFTYETGWNQLKKVILEQVLIRVK